jgi:hypothetical protein
MSRNIKVATIDLKDSVRIIDFSSYYTNLALITFESYHLKSIS